jgi:hypothetical protein
MLNEIISAIESKYKPLELPNFAFASNQPPETQKIISELEKIKYSIKDTTDTNDDVASILSISSKNGNWLLVISWVGPFFKLIRVDGDARKFCDDKNSDSNDREIIEIVKKFDHLNVPAHFLFEKIGMAINLDKIEEIGIYRALYSNTGLFPWASL